MCVPVCISLNDRICGYLPFLPFTNFPGQMDKKKTQITKIKYLQDSKTQRAKQRQSAPWCVTDLSHKNIFVFYNDSNQQSR